MYLLNTIIITNLNDPLLILHDQTSLQLICTSPDQNLDDTLKETRSGRSANCRQSSHHMDYLKPTNNLYTVSYI